MLMLCLCSHLRLLKESLVICSVFSFSHASSVVLEIACQSVAVFAGCRVHHLVQTEISQKLLNGMLWNFVLTVLFIRGWILPILPVSRIQLVIPRLLLVPPWGSHLWFFLNYPKCYWTDWNEIWYRHSYSLQDDLQSLWWSLNCSSSALGSKFQFISYYLQN